MSFTKSLFIFKKKNFFRFISFLVITFIFIFQLKRQLEHSELSPDTSNFVSFFVL